MAVERVKIGLGHKKTSGNGAKRVVENGFERDFVGFGNGNVPSTGKSGGYSVRPVAAFTFNL